jgi:glycine/D-amino acid oxidase-like deaminating enzyme
MVMANAADIKGPVARGSRGAAMAYDAIVVGGGIIGATHAYYLARRGLSVALLDKGAVGGGTTAHNFSWVNASCKTANVPYHRLNALGVSMYEGLAQQFGAAPIGLNPIGSLGIARVGEATTYAAMRKQAADLRALDYPACWLDHAALQPLEPGLSLPDDAEALWSPSDKVLDARTFARFMAQQVRALGGEVFEHCAALELLADDGGCVTGVRSDQGEMRTSRVVVASGPDTPEVLSALTGYDGFAARFPVAKVPGVLVTTPPLPGHPVRHLNYTDDGGEFHFLPDFNGGLRIASDVTDGQIIEDRSPAHLRALAVGLLERMQEYLPDFGGAALVDDCQIAVGIRAYPDDGFSIAGALPGAQGLFVIATHSGVTLAPALGDLMAAAVAQGRAPEMLAPFGLDRLAGFG